MEDPQTDATLRRPPGGPSPPAPPVTGDAAGPDPSDPGNPVVVQLGQQMLGDLGNPRVDARLLSAILTRDGRVAAWLRDQQIDLDDVENAFPGTRW